MGYENVIFCKGCGETCGYYYYDEAGPNGPHFCDKCLSNPKKEDNILKAHKKYAKENPGSKNTGLKQCICCGECPKYTKTEWTENWSCRCGFVAYSEEEWNETIIDKCERSKFRERLAKLIKKFFSNGVGVIQVPYSGTISDLSFESMKKLYAVLEAATKGKKG